MNQGYNQGYFDDYLYIRGQKDHFLMMPSGRITLCAWRPLAYCARTCISVVISLIETQVFFFCTCLKQGHSLQLRTICLEIFSIAQVHSGMSQPYS